MTCRGMEKQIKIGIPEAQAFHLFLEKRENDLNGKRENKTKSGPWRYRRSTYFPGKEKMTCWGKEKQGKIRFPEVKARHLFLEKRENDLTGKRETRQNQAPGGTDVPPVFRKKRE